jgi:hypothetical protein
MQEGFAEGMCFMDIGSALHDYISLILFLYALSSAPDCGIVDILYPDNR